MLVSQSVAANKGTTSSQDILPDLCQSQAVFALVLVAELMAVLLTLAATGLRQFQWETLALYSFFVQWVALVSAMMLCRLRPRFRTWSAVRAGTVSYLVVLGVTVVVAVVGQWLLYVWFAGPADPGFTPDYAQLLTILLIAAILAGVILRYLYVQQQLRNQQQVELNARIQVLQSRIRPHFLFNSMNSIASLIVSAPETAERVVEDLSELFRASLAEPTLVPLTRELDLCRQYLDIEKLRLGERLQVEWQVDPLPDAAHIPSLLLQPLVENAVFHGIEPLPAGGKIVIQVTVKDKYIEVYMTNPVPFTPQEMTKNNNPRHNRMAMDNIRCRLLAHYGARASLSTAVDSETFITRITFPILAMQ